MKLYLVRHGEACEPHQDPQRGLTEKGKADVQKVGASLAERGVRVSQMLHSPKKRARETAEILASHVMPDVDGEGDVKETDGLLPNDEPGVWAERIGEMKADLMADLMLVGHLPYMELLTSLLTTGDERQASIIFETATVVCLDVREGGGGKWTMEWKVTPGTSGGTSGGTAGE